MSGQKILISGGAGFIGCHLARRLSLEADNRVVLLDNLVRGRRDPDLEELLARPNVELVNGDITDHRVFASLGDGFDQAYHLAAFIGVKAVMENPAQVVRVNALGTLNLLDWAGRGGAGRLLFSSTSEAYAWTRLFHELPVPTPEDVPLALTDPTNPRSSYAGSKIFGELAMHHVCGDFGLPYAIVRYHNVYGQRMGFDHVIPQLYERALGGQNPLVVYSADHTRAFCHVDDAVEATMAAMEKADSPGQVFNVGNDREEVPIGDLAKRLLAMAGISCDIQPQPAPHDPITRRCPDLTKAREVLGFQPRVDLDTGLKVTLEWYRPRLEQRLAEKEGAT